MTSPNVPSGTSATGLSSNMAGALAYLLGPITGILFLVIERQDRFVRFHAMQSIMVCFAWIVLSVVLSLFTAVPLVGWIISFLLGTVLGLVGVLLWLFLMWQAFQGKAWEVPVVGAFARQQIGGSV